MPLQRPIPAFLAVWLLVLTASVARPAAAQLKAGADPVGPQACAEVVPGDPVVFRTTDPPLNRGGTFAEFDGVRLVVRDAQQINSFFAGNVADLRVRCRLKESGGSRALQGLGTGALIGGLLGGAAFYGLGAALDSGSTDLGEGILVGVGGGAAVGGLIGLFIGALQNRDRDWVPWNLSTDRASLAGRLYAAPRRNGRWHFGLTLPAVRP